MRGCACLNASIICHHMYRFFLFLRRVNHIEFFILYVNYKHSDGVDLPSQVLFIGVKAIRVVEFTQTHWTTHTFLCKVTFLISLSATDAHTCLQLVTEASRQPVKASCFPLDGDCSLTVLLHLHRSTENAMKCLGICERFFFHA